MSRPAFHPSSTWQGTRADERVGERSWVLVSGQTGPFSGNSTGFGLFPCSQLAVGRLGLTLWSCLT